MRYAAIIATLVVACRAHGVVTAINGANGVIMPGLSIADGTPRDCSSNKCGSQADTAIIRDREIASGKATPLGRTQGNGPIHAETMIANFLGTGAAPKNNGSASSVGEEDNINLGALGGGASKPRQFLAGLFGGGADAGTKGELPDESSVAATAGSGASSGLPTASDDGVVTLTYHGAGPLDADIDGTSGGTDAGAFQKADVIDDVPGIGFQGLSLASNTDFKVTVQMPAAMTCDASVGGADNVCIVRVRNGAAAGPFGGSAAFQQSASGRKRALAFRLKKRFEINRN